MFFEIQMELHLVIYSIVYLITFPTQFISFLENQEARESSRPTSKLNTGPWPIHLKLSAYGQFYRILESISYTMLTYFMTIKQYYVLVTSQTITTR